MLPQNLWLDPRTVIGVLGFIFGVLSYFWNRRESRLDALSKVLEPMVRAAQHLKAANNSRRNCEKLKASFPQPDSAPEAAMRVNEMIGEYGESITASYDEFRKSEAEMASRSFRFPDRISRLVKAAQDSLSEYGRLVNEGMFGKADIQYAKFRDDYKQITKVGRGWRLADPFEGIFKRFRISKENTETRDDFELTQDEMNAILDLVHKRATTQATNTFSVHPPKKLLDNPEIADSDRVIEELADSVFVVVFQDGTSKMMSLVELMVFTYNLIVLSLQHKEVSTMLEAVQPTGSRKLQVSFAFSISDIMRPEMVKTLLDKIEFSDAASDA